MPTCSAAVRSTTTVSTKVVSNTTTSARGARRCARKLRHSDMWYATMVKMPASVAMGMSAAHCPTNSAINSSTTACTMPATGVRPPLLILVAVRAIAPVAGNPPKSGETTLATPCATSSMFERCLPPIIPSATTALSSDSMAASSAIVTAGPARLRTSSMVTCGTCGTGNPPPTVPKREPMVSMGRLNRCAIAVVATNATKGAGTLREMRGHQISIAIVAAVMAVAEYEMVPAWAAYACHFAQKSTGTDAIVRPNASLICPEKMMSAIPLVKPIMTGCGTNLITPPRRMAPMPMSRSPAMTVAMRRPSIPYFATIPAIMMTNAPVGPPICTREPPSAEMMNPATIAVMRPRSGVTPLAIAKAMDSGSATTATIMPAVTSAMPCARV